MGQVTNQAEAPPEVLQAQAETAVADALAKRFQFGCRWQVAFVHLQRQQAGLLRVLSENLEHALEGFVIAQGGGRQAQGQWGSMFVQVREAVFEHGQVEASGPAQAFDPGQEAPGSNRLTLRVKQARQHLVMQQLAAIGTLCDRLEIQLQLAFVQCVVDPGTPIVQALGRLCVVIVQAYPVTARIVLCLRQGLVGAADDLAGVFARAESGNAHMGHWLAVTGTGLAQAFQAAVQLTGEQVGFLAANPWSQQTEFTATAA